MPLFSSMCNLMVIIAVIDVTTVVVKSIIET
jgi:hypothetical protein